MEEMLSFNINLEEREVRLFTCLEYSILIVSYEYGKPEIYLRMNTNNYYIPIYGGINYISGKTSAGGGKNIWAEEFAQEIKVKIKENDCFLQTGSSTGSFYFMKLAGKILRKENENKFLIERELKLTYKPFPREKRIISYMLKTKSNLPIYIVVDSSKFYAEEKERFFVVYLKKIKQFEITRFERYRDGGTTYITVKGNKNKTYEFFYPTPFDKNKFPTFKGEELESVTKEEENTLIELLKLDLA